MNTAYTANTAGTISGLGNEAVTLSGISSAAADLLAINLATSGTVDAFTVTTLTGLASDANDVFAAIGLGIVNLDGDEAVTLSDTTLAATVLNTLNASTTGVVDAASVTTLSGDAADVNTAYTANTAGTISGLGNEAVTLSDTTLAATVLNTLNASTTGVVDAASVTTLSGDAADVNTAYTANTAGTISGLGNEAVTLSDVSLSVEQTNSVSQNTTGIVTAVLTSGNLASFATLAETGNAYTLAVNDASTETLQATALSTLGAKTTAVVSIQNAVTISGTAAELLAALVTSETKVSAGTAKITFTDAPSVAQYQAIDLATSGILTYTSIADTAANLFADSQTGTPVITNKVVTVTDTDPVSAAHLAAISAMTTSTVTVGATSEILGTAADLVSVINDSGISKSASVDLSVTDGTATVAQAAIINGAVTSGDKTFSIVDGSAIQSASPLVLSAATSVTYNGTSTPNNIDMSAYTLDNLILNGLGNDDTVYGSLGSDTINGGVGNDYLDGLTGNDVLTGGTGADSYVFSDSATANGSDTIELLVADVDRLDFNQFLGGGAIDQNGGSSTGIVAHTDADNANSNITGKVSLFDTNAAGLSIANLVAQFVGGEAYSLDANGKAVVISGDATTPANAALVYFIDNSIDGNAAVSAADIALVATTSANFDIDTLTTLNFIV